MGVRYYAAFTDEAKAAAAKNASLRPVATVPDLDGKPPNGWTIYRGRRLADGAGARLRAGGRRRPARRALVAVRRTSPSRSASTAPTAEFSPWECTRCRGSTIPPRSTDR